MLTPINTLLNDNEIQWIIVIQCVIIIAQGIYDQNREQTMRDVHVVPI